MITTLDATNTAIDQRATPPAPVQSGLNEDQLAALSRLVEKRETLDPDRRALVETMAQQYKIPMSPKQGFTASPNPGKDTLQQLGEAAKVAALPMAGQLAGGTIGSISGPVGNITGQALGAIAGVKANDLLGIAKPAPEDYLISALAPVGGLAIGKAGKHLIPGSAAAQQQIGAEALRATPSMLAGSKEAVNAAYQAVGNATVPVGNFSATVSKLLSTEENLKKYGAASATIKRAMSVTADTLAEHPQGIPLQDVNGLLKRYREKVAGLETKGGEQWGAYKDLRRALFADMDAAVTAGGAGGADAGLLRTAMQQAKQNIAKQEYTEILNTHGTKLVTVSGQTFEQIDPTKVLNKLQDIGFEQSVGKQQYGKIVQTLKELAKIPRPDSSFRTSIGSEGRAIALGSAGAIGGALGGITGGAGVAAAAYAGMKVHDAVANLFMSDRGRSFLVKLFKHNQGKIGEQTAQVLQFAANQLEDTP